MYKKLGEQIVLIIIMSLVLSVIEAMDSSIGMQSLGIIAESIFVFYVILVFLPTLFKSILKFVRSMSGGVLSGVRREFNKHVNGVSYVEGKPDINIKPEINKSAYANVDSGSFKDSYESESGYDYFSYHDDKGLKGEATVFFVLDHLDYYSKTLSNVVLCQENGEVKFRV